MAQTPKYAFLFVVFIMFTFLVDAGNHFHMHHTEH